MKTWLFEHSTELIATLVVLGAIVILKFLLHSIVVKRILKKQFDRNRRKIISKVFNLALTLATIIGLVSIWGLNQSDIILFVSSALTILGVAFFAQWSHLSNITAGVILFFDSSIKIGDTITILEKDFNITGKIDDIDSLSVKLATDQGVILVPNNLLLQKPIKIEEPKNEPIV